MPQDTVDDAGIRNEGDDAHAAAAGAKQGIRLEDFLNQASPCAPGFPGATRIVLLGMFRCRQAGAFCICVGCGNAGSVRICTLESLTMASRIRDMYWIHSSGSSAMEVAPDLGSGASSIAQVGSGRIPLPTFV
jgi:hypothetical protein